MPSSSSTSSSELSAYERVRPGRTPIAAIAFILAVFLIEAFVGAERVWFADLAAWQWESKRALIDAGQLDGDVAIFGTSVLFHGLDPSVANVGPLGEKVVNLALNGMNLQHEVQLLRQRLASNRPPAVAVIEFRMVNAESWTLGPYFTWWASFSDFLESRFYYWNAPLALTFAADRLLPTLRYREGLRNWLIQSVQDRRPVTHTRDRNTSTRTAMRDHFGHAPAGFEDRFLTKNPGPPGERPWVVNAGGELWLQKMMQAAAAHGTRVVLLVPPAPPYLAESPGPDGFRARVDAQVRQVRQEYPTLDIEVFAPAGYALEDFVDDIHLSARGREKLGQAFAGWIGKYRARH